MNHLYARCQALWATRDKGATAVEYGLMVALIGVAIIGAVTAFGSKLSDVFNGVAGKITAP